VHLVVADWQVLTLADDTASEHSTSSPPRSSPLSSISLGPFLATGVRVAGVAASPDLEPTHRQLSSSRRPKSPAFQIYEEPLQTQLDREAAAPAPIDFPDDDKENSVEAAEYEDEEDFPDNISYHDPSRITEERIGAVDDASTDYVAPSMFDTSSDRMGYVRHTISSQSMTPNGTANDERDSVLGSLSPRPSFDHHPVMGDRSAGGSTGNRATQKTPPGGFTLFR
jgi:hypothetical protein